MSRTGSPDWATYERTQGKLAFDDWGRTLAASNAELAVRLDSPVVYQQSGRVLVLEDFDHGDPLWTEQLSGNLAAIAIDPTTCESAGYSLKLTAGSTASHFARVLLNTGLLVTSHVGLALSFARDALFEDFSMEIRSETGTQVRHAGVRLVRATGQIQVKTGAVAWTNVAAYRLIALGKINYNHLKVIADLTTLYYEDIYLNQESIDASAYRPYYAASGAVPQLTLYIQLTGDLGDNDSVWLDNVVFTTNDF